ncbi:polyketide cyclase / dehydrase and lipid transport [Spongisporangium articulatum]|uniref:Polyketide cyclase / dehydrase and lipid transport n=1 Tax=Spongisporangium articulatum TaxID=3362603 RepID=A0ABW8ASV2_9ACTN
MARVVEDVEVTAGDEAFIALPPALLAPRIVAGAGGCWPDLEFTVTRDRGAKGCQWSVAGGARGTAEVWLEPWQDGTVVHLYLRLRATPGRRGRVRPDAEAREHAWTRWLLKIKDEVDADRPVGTPPRLPAG